MIGDIVLFIKEWWKKLTCIHDYKHKEFGSISLDQCSKCGKVKNYIDLK